MTYKIVIYILLNLSVIKIYCQRLEIYGGPNYTHGLIKYNFNSRPDSLIYHRGNLGFQLGYRVYSKLNNSLKLLFGLELMHSSLRVANEDIFGTFVLEPNGDTFSIKILNKNFKTFQVRIPIHILIPIIKNYNLGIGISPSYYIRKNNSFLYGYYNIDGHLITRSAYKKFHFQTSVELSKNFNNFNFRINYNYELAPYYDTGREYNTNFRVINYDREFGVMHHLTFSIGYFFYK